MSLYGYLKKMNKEWLTSSSYEMLTFYGLFFLMLRLKYKNIWDNGKGGDQFEN